MKRLPLFLTIIVIYFLVTEGAGFIFEYKNDDYGQVSFGIIKTIVYFSSHTALIAAVFFIPHKNIVKNTSSPVGVLRRLGAVHINMLAVMLPVQFIASLSILTIGFIYTGEFSGVFYGETHGIINGIVAGLSLPMVIGLGFYYYYSSLKNSQPTIGQYLMGYYISGNNEEWTVGRAWERFGSAAITYSIWPISAIIAASNPQKTYWFDRRTNSFAVKFDYTSNQGNKLEETKY